MHLKLFTRAAQPRLRPNKAALATRKWSCRRTPKTDPRQAYRLGGSADHWRVARYLLRPFLSKITRKRLIRGLSPSLPSVHEAFTAENQNYWSWLWNAWDPLTRYAAWTASKVACRASCWGVQSLSNRRQVWTTTSYTSAVARKSFGWHRKKENRRKNHWKAGSCCALIQKWWLRHQGGAAY